MIDVENKLDIYELKAEDLNYDCDMKLIVKNHWNYNDRVILKIGDNEYTVDAEDLEAAIKNATNINRW